MKKYKTMIILLGVFVVLVGFYFGMQFLNKVQTENNKDEIISFSNSLEYNKYATISFTASHLKSKGNNNNIDENSKGYAFILGLELSL